MLIKNIFIYLFSVIKLCKKVYVSNFYIQLVPHTNYQINNYYARHNEAVLLLKVLFGLPITNNNNDKLAFIGRFKTKTYFLAKRNLFFYVKKLKN